LFFGIFFDIKIKEKSKELHKYIESLKNKNELFCGFMSILLDKGVKLGYTVTTMRETKTQNEEGKEMKKEIMTLDDLTCKNCDNERGGFCLHLSSALGKVEINPDEIGCIAFEEREDS
jgi:hypothetical protein